MRGEYEDVKGIAHKLAELPPRARRIRLAIAAVVAGLGTTSACAENTLPRKATTEHKGNYLRVRGEYPK